jgi:hypothetical protein
MFTDSDGNKWNVVGSKGAVFVSTWDAEDPSNVDVVVIPSADVVTLISLILAARDVAAKEGGAA